MQDINWCCLLHYVFGICADLEIHFFSFIQSAGNLVPLAGRQKPDTERGILSYFIIIFPQRKCAKLGDMRRKRVRR